jgi:hypothetical protein
VLSSLPGYVGFIENFEKTLQSQKTLKSKKISLKNSLLGPGLLGAFGDIIVDDVNKVTKILAVCDGKGDVLYQQEAADAIIQILNEMDDKTLANQIKQLYFHV